VVVGSFQLFEKENSTKKNYRCIPKRGQKCGGLLDQILETEVEAVV
jgi:hypothetical protein